MDTRSERCSSPPSTYSRTPTSSAACSTHKTHQRHRSNSDSESSSEEDARRPLATPRSPPYTRHFDANCNRRRPWENPDRAFHKDDDVPNYMIDEPWMPPPDSIPRTPPPSRDGLLLAPEWLTERYYEERAREEALRASHQHDDQSIDSPGSESREGSHSSRGDNDDNEFGEEDQSSGEDRETVSSGTTGHEEGHSSVPTRRYAGSAATSGVSSCDCRTCDDCRRSDDEDVVSTIPSPPRTYRFNPERYPAYDAHARRVGMDYAGHDTAAPRSAPRVHSNGQQHYHPRTRKYPGPDTSMSSTPQSDPAMKASAPRRQQAASPRVMHPMGSHRPSDTSRQSRSQSHRLPLPSSPSDQDTTMRSASSTPSATVSSLPSESHDPEPDLRRMLGLGDGEAISLDALADPPLGEKPGYALPTLVKLAIYGSPKKRLTLQEIYAALENRFPWYKDNSRDKAWQNSIRHNLSLNKCFRRVPKPITEPGKGSYWVVDYSQGEGNKRQRKRNKRPTKAERLKREADAKAKARAKVAIQDEESDFSDDESVQAPSRQDTATPSIQFDDENIDPVLRNQGNIVGQGRTRMSAGAVTRNAARRAQSPYMSVASSTQSSRSNTPATSFGTARQTSVTSPAFGRPAFGQPSFGPSHPAIPHWTPYTTSSTRSTATSDSSSSSAHPYQDRPFGLTAQQAQSRPAAFVPATWISRLTENGTPAPGAAGHAQAIRHAPIRLPTPKPGYERITEANGLVTIRPIGTGGSRDQAATNKPYAGFGFERYAKAVPHAPSRRMDMDVDDDDDDYSSSQGSL